MVQRWGAGVVVVGGGGGSGMGMGMGMGSSEQPAARASDNDDKPHFPPQRQYGMGAQQQYGQGVQSVQSVQLQRKPAGADSKGADRSLSQRFGFPRF